MCPDTSDQARSTAIEQLKAFGLTTYAAQTFVALVSLGDGTAQDVSAVSEVPRTRVYDAAAELRDRGLVDVQHSTPKRFASISAETTGRRFHYDYAHRVNVLTDALDELEPISRSEEQRGVWTVTGRGAVVDRTLEFIDAATDEVVYMTVEELLDDECLEALRAAADRGVAIRLAGQSSDVRSRAQREIPEAETFESIWEWSDVSAGRLLMVDEKKTLASVLVSDDGAHPPEFREETAIWGTGETNSLVVVLKELFAWQLDGIRGDE
ncbi:helix-turn-helix domain-containing protein [Halorubrum sp. AD140]|uniref:TrmB family transcriptional regulator n=1 Tax=Halorubrum sp. AD140 TaxID=3050073 RepID=UPI002ACC47DF|nr:helix-turn-helix domain-containing protein [Halorubrum sp. AD140]MDZ5812418.1 helix-turn-helix domain-containing protein [Halorubrum sp. AD140]